MRIYREMLKNVQPQFSGDRTAAVDLESPGSSIASVKKMKTDNII